MLIEVFRSARKAETYLYLPKGADPASLPASLRQVFGRLEYVLGMNLTAERRLARYTGAEVLDAIVAQGFFLQMPETPRPDSEAAEPC
jgi:uncharacterized protein YcgL (UPF0745 family)